MMSIAAFARPGCLLASVLLAGACAQGPDRGTDDTVQPPPGTELRLEGRTFASVQVTRDGAPVELAPQTQIRLSFSDGRLTASAGCNTMSAATTYDEAVLRISDSLAMTEMGCDSRRHAQDEWLASVLTARPTLILERHGLTIRRADLEIELRDIEVLEPDRPLLRTRWVLQAIGGRDDESSASSVSLAHPPTIVFTRHRASIFTGCNSGSGEVTVSARVVSFAQVDTTSMLCPGERGEADNAVLSVMRFPCHVDITGSTLTLTSRAGMLSYTAD